MESFLPGQLQRPNAVPHGLDGRSSECYCWAGGEKNNTLLFIHPSALVGGITGLDWEMPCGVVWACPVDGTMTLTLHLSPLHQRPVTYHTLYWNSSEQPCCYHFPIDIGTEVDYAYGRTSDNEIWPWRLQIWKGDIIFRKRNVSTPCGAV